MASDDLNKFIEAEYEQKAGGEDDIVLRYDSNGFGTTVDKSFFEYVTSFASDTADVAVDVSKGRVTPDGPLDFLRGILTGKSGRRQRN